MAKYTVGLSAKEFRNLAKQIREYRESLSDKCDEFTRRLLDLGVGVADVAINEVPIGKTIVLQTDIDEKTMGCKAVITMLGRETKTEDGRTFYTALAIEFGSGVRYNPVSNPKSSEFGMGVGTFPGQTHAYDPNGWWYLGDDGDWHHSYGVHASMPMYKASKEMRENILYVAREVFES